MWLKKLCLGLLIATALIATLSLPNQERHLSQVLLCPVCSGQSLFESNHPVALALNHTIDTWATQGLADQQIAHQIEQEYGPAVNALEAWVLKGLIYLSLIATAVHYVIKKRP